MVEIITGIELLDAILNGPNTFLAGTVVGGLLAAFFGVVAGTLAFFAGLG